VVLHAFDIITPVCNYSYCPEKNSDSCCRHIDTSALWMDQMLCTILQTPTCLQTMMRFGFFMMALSWRVALAAQLQADVATYMAQVMRSIKERISHYSHTDPNQQVSTHRFPLCFSHTLHRHYWTCSHNWWNVYHKLLKWLDFCGVHAETINKSPFVRMVEDSRSHSPPFCSFNTWIRRRMQGMSRGMIRCIASMIGPTWTHR